MLKNIVSVTHILYYNVKLNIVKSIKKKIQTLTPSDSSIELSTGISRISGIIGKMINYIKIVG